MSLPNASGKEAEKGTYKRDSDPSENGKIPVKGLGESRKAVGRESRAHVGGSVENARIGRNLAKYHKSARNDGNEHQVNAVHSGNGQCHQDKRGNKRRLWREEVDGEQKRTNYGRATKYRGGTRNLVFEKSLLQGTESRIANHCKDGENHS